MSTTTPNLGLYIPASGDGSNNGLPWGVQMQENFEKIDTFTSDLAATTGAGLVGGLPFVSVMSYGATGNGVTDDTANIATAVAAANGKRLVFPFGTYIINTLSITGSADIDLTSGATLKHKTSASGNMIEFTGTRLSITGGFIDGNQANQPGVIYAVSCALPSTANVIVNGVTFTNTANAAVAATNSGGHLYVDRCKFSAMREHDGTLQHDTCAVSVQSGETGKKGFLRFNDNTLVGTVTPVLPGASPGGIFFAPTLDYVNGVGNFSTLEAIGNHFYGIGQNCGGNDIAPIHTYPSTDGARVIGNYFEGCGFSAIAAKSVKNFICTDNVIVNGQTSAQNDPTSGAIYYTPGDHSGSTVRPRAVISNNIIDTPGGTATVKQNGISVIGSPTSVATQVVIANNVINGCGDGIWIDRATDVSITGNKINGSTGGTANTEHGIILNNISSVAMIYGNYVVAPNGYGIAATNANTTAKFHVDGNYVIHSTAGSYGMILRGMALVKLTGNIIDSTTSAISVSWDGATKPAFYWERSNQILNGTVSFDFANLTSAAGHIEYPNAPDGLVPATAGALYTRNSGGVPALYIKETGGGTTGWRPVETNALGGDQNANSGITLTATLDAPVQFFTTALTAARTITLSTSGASNGDMFRIIRTAGDTGGPWNLSVGGLKNLAANTWCEVSFGGSGNAWVLTGYGTL